MELPSQTYKKRRVTHVDEDGVTPGGLRESFSEPEIASNEEISTIQSIESDVNTTEIGNYEEENHNTWIVEENISAAMLHAVQNVVAATKYSFLKANFLQLLEEFEWIGWREDRHLQAIMDGRVFCCWCDKEISARDRQPLRQHDTGGKHERIKQGHQKQASLVQCFGRSTTPAESKRKLERTALLSAFVASKGLPFGAQEEIFKPMVVKLARNSTIGSRRTNTIRDTPEAVRIIKEAIQRRLEDRPVTICFDASLSSAHICEYLVIQAIHPELESPLTLAAVVTEGKHKHQSLATALLNCMDDYQIKPSNIAAFCCDNEPVNKAALRIIFEKSTYSHAVQLHCISHGINLILKHFMNQFTGIHEFLNNVRTLLFATPAARKKRCAVLDREYGVTPGELNATDVRWGTKFQALAELNRTWLSFQTFLQALREGKHGMSTNSPLAASLLSKMRSPFLQAQVQVCCILLKEFHKLLEITQGVYVKSRPLAELKTELNLLRQLTNTDGVLQDMFLSIDAWPNLEENEQNTLIEQTAKACSRALQAADENLCDTIQLLENAFLFFGKEAIDKPFRLHGQGAGTRQHSFEIMRQWNKAKDRDDLIWPETRRDAFAKFWRNSSIGRNCSNVARRALAYVASNATVERAFSSLNGIFHSFHRATTSLENQSAQALCILNKPLINELIQQTNKFS